MHVRVRVHLNCEQACVAQPTRLLERGLRCERVDICSLSEVLPDSHQPHIRTRGIASYSRVFLRPSSRSAATIVFPRTCTVVCVRESRIRTTHTIIARLQPCSSFAHIQTGG